ncbi:PREDICTED: uncharacterized protein LOC109238512 isoform X2 [Nicotiana attenuata]|uniref:uncharacterized protein LOC109238512 isoform X2 n=1 Tax=Nicotiana attenuata TaxID=49451 RepID=UPI000904B864|nr:PREDICTED: uncharacterized protein LOC109238512 isoform X2 [Nicotiana attenuata]
MLGAFFFTLHPFRTQRQKRTKTHKRGLWDIQMHKVVFEKDASRDGTALLFTFRNQVEQHNLEGTNPQQMIIIMPNSTYIRSAEQG